MMNELYKNLVEKSIMGYAYHRIICDKEGVPRDYEFIEVNQAFERFTGLKREDILEKKVTEVLPSILEDDFDWIGYYGEIALHGKEKTFDQYALPQNKWFRIHVFSFEKGYFATSFVDITEEKEKLDEIILEAENSKKEYDKLVKENNDNKLKKQELGNKLKLKEQEVKNNIASIEKSIHYEKEKLAQSFNNIEEYKSNLVDLNKDLIELKESLPEKPEKISEVEIDRLESLKIDANERDSAIQKNKWIKENNSKLKEQEDADKKERESINEELDSVVKDIAVYKSAIEVLKKNFPNYIINSMKSELEQGMNDLLTLAYNGKYTVSIKENKSGLIITYGKKDKDINLASGAETNIFNIGFKNSFNQIAGLGVLILDEALNFADDNIAKNVFESISQMIEQKKLNQVFVITHKQNVKETLISDYKARVYEVNDGVITLLEN